MSQTSVLSTPVAAVEGMRVDVSPGDLVVSRKCTDAVVPFGKFVVQQSADANDECSLPDLTGEVSGGLLLGVAIADFSKEKAASPTYGHWALNETVSILRRGRIWMYAEDAIAAGVLPFVRFTDPGGSPPLASLGSIRSDADGTDAVQPAAGVKTITSTSGAGLIKVEISLA